MMINFEPETTGSFEAPEPTGRTFVSREYLDKSDWDWDDLRDYVVYEIESRWGVFPRDSIKESGIFKSFLKRWPQARQIAEYVFEAEGGQWRGRQVSIYSFMKAEDENFAAQIAERLDETT